VQCFIFLDVILLLEEANVRKENAVYRIGIVIEICIGFIRALRRKIERSTETQY